MCIRDRFKGVLGRIAVTIVHTHSRLFQSFSVFVSNQRDLWLIFNARNNWITKWLYLFSERWIFVLYLEIIVGSSFFLFFFFLFYRDSFSAFRRKVLLVFFMAFIRNAVVCLVSQFFFFKYSLACWIWRYSFNRLEGCVPT